MQQIPFPEISFIRYPIGRVSLKNKHDLPRLISKIEDPVPERRSLERYKRILREGVDLCVYCNDPLSSDRRQIHADHFIPWSYVYEDEIWNLVLTYRSCSL